MFAPRLRFFLFFCVFFLFFRRPGDTLFPFLCAWSVIWDGKALDGRPDGFPPIVKALKRVVAWLLLLVDLSILCSLQNDAATDCATTDQST
jgi:hypothetical protein